jgi:hypothetical protein
VTVWGRGRRLAPSLAFGQVGSLARSRPMLVRRRWVPVLSASAPAPESPAGSLSRPAERPPDAQDLGHAPGLEWAAARLERWLGFQDLRDGTETRRAKVVLERP